MLHQQSERKIRLNATGVMISIPADSSTERRAVIDAAIRAGAKAAYVVAEGAGGYWCERLSTVPRKYDN
jgi:actin-like ATPase involved in cell morphogenesis